MRFIGRFPPFVLLLLTLSVPSATAQLLEPAALNTSIAATPHLGYSSATGEQIREWGWGPSRQRLSLRRGLAATSISAAGAVAGGFLGYFLYWNCTSEDDEPDAENPVRSTLGCLMSPLFGFYGSLGGLFVLPEDVRKRTATSSTIGGLIQLVPILLMTTATNAFVSEDGDFSWKAFQVLNIGPVLGFTVGWATSKRGVRLRLISPHLQRLPDIGQPQNMGVRTGVRLRW